MPITPSKFNIKAYNKDYKPGETITGLSSDEEDRLIKAGFAVRVVADNQQLAPVLADHGVIEPEGVQVPSQPEKTSEIDTSERLDIVALRKTLEGLTKADMITYAEKAKVVGVASNIKNADIINLIIQDALEKGVDFDSFTDKQLTACAVSLGINTADKSRAEIMTSIDLLMGEEDG